MDSDEEQLEEGAGIKARQSLNAGNTGAWTKDGGEGDRGWSEGCWGSV